MHGQIGECARDKGDPWQAGERIDYDGHRARLRGLRARALRRTGRRLAKRTALVRPMVAIVIGAVAAWMVPARAKDCGICGGL